MIFKLILSQGMAVIHIKMHYLPTKYDPHGDKSGNSAPYYTPHEGRVN